MSDAVRQQCSPKPIQLGHGGDNSISPLWKKTVLVYNMGQKALEGCYFWHHHQKIVYAIGIVYSKQSHPARQASGFWRQCQKIPLQARTSGDLHTTIKGGPWEASQVPRYHHGDHIQARYGSDAGKIKASCPAGTDWNFPGKIEWKKGKEKKDSKVWGAAQWFLKEQMADSLQVLWNGLASRWLWIKRGDLCSSKSAWTQARDWSPWLGHLMMIKDWRCAQVHYTTTDKNLQHCGVSFCVFMTCIHDIRS